MSETKSAEMCIMIKRMLIDDTQPEETRVVVINGNKLEDVEFETSNRRQIKGNIYLAKVMRVEPSLQACFVDYGGNKHGFLAFGEIHPDYYNLSQETLDEVDREVDEIIENKKKALRERELERERIRKEKAAAREERLRLEAEKAAQEAAAQEAIEKPNETEAQPVDEGVVKPEENEVAVLPEVTEDSANNDKGVEANPSDVTSNTQATEDENNTENTPVAETEQVQETSLEKKKNTKKRLLKKRYRKEHPKESEEKKAEETALKVLAENIGNEDDKITEDADESEVTENIDTPNDNAETSACDCENEALENQNYRNDNDDDLEEADDDDDDETDFEIQRKLIRARKLYHRSKIQDVIKEGQVLMVQVVKEERGNKGAALTTYLSLAGRYCVLMPNRIKSGGVSRKITNAADRTRLKGIVKELPLTADMSIIVRTAGEEKTKADIVRDYNYLIRSWNQIRLDALKAKAPIMIHEEGNLIKRALRDIYTKDISEIIVAGDEGYKLAKDFFRILSPHSLKKIKHYKNGDIPLFQRFQVETQLDKLHDPNAQLESGGYLVINPTEALVSIDVNSGRATKEKDLEETALKTNLEACDEIARQLRMRNLAGLVVIDFIDMDEPANNHAVEKRMKEVMKKDRSRIQIGKMSMFGLLELSRQRMHSSFFESNYQVCPFCQGRGMVRTTESSAVYILRGIEEEGIKGRSSRINVFVPADIAIYLLNQKRQTLINLEQKYKMEVIISADNSIKCISDYRIERSKIVKPVEEEKVVEAPVLEEDTVLEEKKLPVANENKSAEKAEDAVNEGEDTENGKDNSYRKRRRDGRRRGRNRFERNQKNKNSRSGNEEKSGEAAAKQEPVILYDSHEDTKSVHESLAEKPAEEKSTWWKKLIKG